MGNREWVYVGKSMVLLSGAYRRALYLADSQHELGWTDGWVSDDASVRDRNGNPFPLLKFGKRKRLEWIARPEERRGTPSKSKLTLTVNVGKSMVLLYSS